MINVNIYKLADNLIIIIPTAEGKVSSVPVYVYSRIVLYEILNYYNLYSVTEQWTATHYNWVSTTRSAQISDRWVFGLKQTILLCR